MDRTGLKKSRCEANFQLNAATKLIAIGVVSVPQISLSMGKNVKGMVIMMTKTWPFAQ